MLDPIKHPWILEVQKNTEEFSLFIEHTITSVYAPGMIVWFPVYIDHSTDSDYHVHVLVIQNGYRLYDSRKESEDNAVLRSLEHNNYKNQTIGFRLFLERCRRPMPMTKRAKQLMLEVSETAGVPMEAFTRPGRVLKVHTEARNLLWYRIHDELEYSVSTIARMFERDFSTVKYGITQHRLK